MGLVYIFSLLYAMPSMPAQMAPGWLLVYEWAWCHRWPFTCRHEAKQQFWWRAQELVPDRPEEGREWGGDGWTLGGSGKTVRAVIVRVPGSRNPPQDGSLNTSIELLLKNYYTFYSGGNLGSYISTELLCNGMLHSSVQKVNIVIRCVFCD